MANSFPFKLNDKGHVINRESFDIEFKANFHLGDKLLEYCRSLVGMANNKGGRIVFGITDNPRKPEGMTNTKFIDCDPKKINASLLEYFSPEMEWEMSNYEVDERVFGEIYVKEASNKPVLCKKNGGNILREGAIYYRYRGETKEIRYAELNKILEKEKEKEKILWLKHIEKISISGPQNVHILDMSKGELHTNNGKLLVDKHLIDKIKFIKEGTFSEVDGAPALKLIGEIEGFAEVTSTIDPDIAFPLFEADIKRDLNLNGYEIKCILWGLDIKNKAKFHTEIKAGRNSNLIHKYSPELIPVLKRIMEKPNFLAECKKAYSEKFLKGKTRSVKRKKK